MMSLRNLSLVAGSMLAWVVAGGAIAQDYPNKAIRMVIPNSAGTTSDIAARLMTPEMGKILGQPVVIDNRVGAGGAVGYDHVAKRVPADGYVLICASVSDLATLPIIATDVQFDPVKDLPPFLGFAETRYYLGSTAKRQWANYAEMVAEAKTSKNKLNFGVSGALSRLAAQAFMHGMGATLVIVPYNGAAGLNKALVSGEVDIAFKTESSIKELQFRPLAVTGDKRHPSYPQIPTLTELGQPPIPGISYSFNLPAGVPRAAFDKLSAATQKALLLPEVKGAIEKTGLDVTAHSAEVARKILADQARLFADVAKKVGASSAGN